jgi:hypothetical protein
MVWKRGPQLRIDGSLLGLDENPSRRLPAWKRGHFSVLLAPSDDGPSPSVCVVNHTRRTFTIPGKRRPPPVCVRLQLTTVGAGTRTRVGAALCVGRLFSEDEVRFRDCFYGHDELRLSVTGVDASMRPLKDWVGRPLVETVSGLRTDVWEAASRLRSTSVTKRNRPAASGVVRCCEVL